MANKKYEVIDQMFSAQVSMNESEESIKHGFTIALMPAKGGEKDGASSR